jgi:hypothetical protein
MESSVISPVSCVDGPCHPPSVAALHGDNDDSPLGRSLRALGARTESRLDGCSFAVAGVEGRYTLGEVDDHDDGPSTHCRVRLPAEAPPFAMDVRPRTAAEERALERGDAIDLDLGDEPFDRAFVVEAAPADVIRVLVDGATRAALLSLRPCRFALDAGDLHLSKPGTWTAPPDVARIVRLCLDVRERAGRLPVEMARHHELAGYRGAMTTAAARQRDLARAASEIDAVKAVRRSRRQSASATVGIAVLGFVVVTGFVGTLLHC